MKVLASVFLYPIWHEKIGQPDPLAPGYVGRYSPQASATGFDTHELCQRVAAQEKPYTWQLMNWRIAVKEFAISGSEHNQRIRDLQFLLFLKETLLGNHRLVKQMSAESKHFLVDDTLAGLCTKMNALTGTQDVKPEVLQHTADAFDANFSRGDSVVNDDQIRRIEHARHWGRIAYAPANRHRYKSPARGGGLWRRRCQWQTFAGGRLPARLHSHGACCGTFHQYRSRPLRPVRISL